MKKEIKTPNRNLTVQIEENQYTIEFPNTGKLMDIELRKMLYSNGSYNELLQSTLRNSELILDVIDTVSYFDILIPQLKKDLKVTSIFELDIRDTIKIIKVFKKEFVPWFNDWMKIINAELIEIEEDNDKIEENNE